MKKLLSFIATIGLVSASGASVVACARPGKAEELTFANSNLEQSYRVKYAYQTGPDKSAKNLNKNLTNEFITSFNGSAYSTYSSYRTPNGIYNPVFNGDKNQYVKTGDDKFSTVGWKNDSVNFQNILVFKKDVTKYKNISISVKDVTKNLKDDEKLSGDIKFEKYMLSQKHGTTNIPAMKESILNEREYVPDAIGENWMDDLSQNVSDNGYYDVSDNSKLAKPRKVYFDVWNSWVSLNSGPKAKSGKHNIEINISFQYGDKLYSFNKYENTLIKDTLFTKKDNNTDDPFGMSVVTYPVNEMKQWKHNLYSADRNSNIDCEVKRGTKKFDVNIENLIKDKDTSDIKVVTKYISYGSLVSTTQKDKNVEFTVENPSVDFMGFFAVEKAEKLIGTISVYYNKYGLKSLPAVYNSTTSILNDSKNPSDIIDINGDGKTDKDDWDIDGDGKYTQEDYAASGQTDKDGNLVSDEIGPNPRYKDAPRMTPEQWNDLNTLDDPIKDFHSSFLTGNGTPKQLIQYSGRLIDDKLGANGPKLNIQDGFADAYEKALAEANKSPDGYSNFIKSRAGHKWEWTFDFTNLDLYLRLAASKNIPYVMINPVDVGGFSFWYLKGKNPKLGPARYLGAKTGTMSMLDTGTRTLSKVGHAFVENVLPEFTKALSKHIADTINKENLFSLKNGKPVKIYFTFDETNEEVVDDTMKVVENNEVNGGKIYSSYFVGWKSDIGKAEGRFDLNNKYVMRDMNDKYIYQIIFQYRNFVTWLDNDDLSTVRQIILDRHKKDPLRTTMFYSTYDSYPGGYCQSDLAGSYWQLFLSYKLGMNGYARWAYGNNYDDYYDSSVIDWDRQINHVSGQAFLIYGGSDKGGVRYSVRLKAYTYAVNYIYKIKQIMDGDDAAMKSKISAVLQSVGVSSVYFSNNDYKWNAKNEVNDSDFRITTKNYEVSLSEQVYQLIYYLNSL